MSTIVAVEKNGRIAVAADSLLTVGPLRLRNATGVPKLQRVGSSVVGLCGFGVYRALLQSYATKSRGAPRLRNEAEILQFFVGFWRKLREDYHFVEDQFESDDPSPFADLGAEFLVANASGMYVVKEIISVTRYERFCAIGSGAPHAEGALEALHAGSEDAAALATRAVEIACEFDRSSGGEVQVVELQAKNAAPDVKKKPR